MPTDDLRRRLLGALPDGTDEVAVSRVSTLPFVELLAPLRVVELPVVWGRTLWSLATAWCIVEMPNGLGYLETPPEDRDAIVVTTSAGATVPWGGSSARIDAAPASPPPSGDEAAIARRLRTRLTQIPGVRPALPGIESARFVVLYPTGTAGICGLAPPSGLRVGALPVRLAEYPGAVRYEVVPGAIESEMIAYAQGVGAHVLRARGTE